MNNLNDAASQYKRLQNNIGNSRLKKLYDRPIFIIAAPRSGSTLLFESLSQNRNLWTLGEECHTIYRAIPTLDPSIKNFDSGALTRAQATPETSNLVRAGFTMYLRNNNGTRYMQTPDTTRPAKLRFLEKTPRNSLNIPFLNKIFPDAIYIYLIREAAANINSIIEAWETGLQDGSFVTFQDLDGWHLKHWCMLLPPKWRELNNKSLAEVAAFQWKSCNEEIVKDLKDIPSIRKTYIKYEDLIATPGPEISRLLKFCKLKTADQTYDLTRDTLPLSKTTVSKPNTEKWKKRFDDINPLLADLQPLNHKLNTLFES